MKKEIKKAQGSNKGLFVTDFDGTLLRSDGTVARRDLDALATLTRCGISTAVATGRSLYSFNCSPGVELPVDYIIFTTGAGVVTQPEGRLVYTANISAQVVAKALKILNKSAFDFMLHHPVPENHRFVYRRATQNNTDFETRLDRYRQFGSPLNSIDGKGFGEAAQFLAVVPRQDTESALKAVRNELTGLSVIHTTSPLDHQSTWIEIFHPDVCKSTTAAWLAKKLSVKPKDTMAVGNDYNDLDLLTWAATSFVVGNAPQDLRDGFHVVASNNDCGVAEAVSRWLE